MHTSLRGVRSMKKKKQCGFTLLELLTVLSIIGLLSAMVIPQYKSFRQRAYDVRAQADLRSLALAEEAYYLDAERYLSCENTQCIGLPSMNAISKGVQLKATARAQDFSAEAHHPKGTGKTWLWDSAKGGPQF